MRMWLLAVAAVLLMPVGADAAGLGRLNVMSYLGQPLNAEIELVSVQKNETFTARLAPIDIYQRAGVPYDVVLGTARVTVNQRANGDQYLKVTTGRPLTEPFLELVIELNSQHGAGKGGQISAEVSRTAVFVIPTNEELLIARDAVRVVSGAPQRF